MSDETKPAPEKKPSPPPAEKKEPVSLATIAERNEALNHLYTIREDLVKAYAGQPGGNVYIYLRTHFDPIVKQIRDSASVTSEQVAEARKLAEHAKSSYVHDGVTTGQPAPIPTPTVENARRKLVRPKLNQPSATI